MSKNRSFDDLLPKEESVLPVEPVGDPVVHIRLKGQIIEYADSDSIKLTNGIVIFAKDSKLFVV
jgi:hypothetical protein